MSDLRLLAGFVDLSCAFGEPGAEQAETIHSGLLAAARGGFAAVVLEPFTDPPIDTDAQVCLALQRADSADCQLLPLASATRDKGALTEMDLLAEAGAVGVHLGDLLPDAGLLRSVLEYAAQRLLPVFVHPAESSLARGGVVHEGGVSEMLGLKGCPSVVEEVGLGILLPLVRRTGARVHLCRLSTAEGVEMVRAARAQGLPVTADVGFRHLVATEDAVAGFDANWRVWPPLRTERDRQALWEGLRDGTIDAIVSHHHPVPDELKRAEFDRSPAGAIGLETLFPALWTARLEGRVPGFGLDDVHRWLCEGPRRVLGLPPAPSAEIDGSWWDFGDSWTPSDATLSSLSRNCPEIGRELTPRFVRLRRGGCDIV